MSRFRTLTALAATIAVGVTAAPAVADVSKHETIKAGEKSPVRIPGTKVKKGSTLGKGTKLVHRTVTLDDADDTVRFVLSCGKGHRMQGIGVPEGGGVAFNLVGDDVDYIGDRAGKRRGDAIPEAGELEGTVYVLCAR